MYHPNALANALRHGSLGRDTATFATLPDTGTTLSHASLWTRAEKVASALIAAGLRPGDRVAVQAEKSLEVVALYLGTILAGGVHLPLNPACTTPEVAYFLQDAEPLIFVCTPEALATLSPVAKPAGVAHILTLDATGGGTLTEAVATAPPLTKPVPRGPDDLAAILYTSGTTGRSKGAMLSHGNLVSNARTLCAHWRFTPQDVLIHALPIFHTHGLFVALNLTLMAGSALIFHQGFNAEAILRDLGRASVLMGVPTFYTRLLAQPGLDRKATEGMRLFVSGSAPLMAATHAEWQARTGHAILERYGMTETNMNTSNPYDGPRRAGTVGLPLPGVELRLADAEGRPVGRGQPGIIELRGPNVFQGYWRMPEKTAAELRPDGFFITGDIGQVDAEGYVSIIGRAKDMIISGGYNIYPKEIETLIDALPGVIESAVFGLPDPDLGECVAAAIVTEAWATLTEADITAALAPQLARYKLPRCCFFLDALPRNAMGKVQKNQLRTTAGGNLD